MENIFRIELNLFSVIIPILIIWMFFHHIKDRCRENKIFLVITYATLAELIVDSCFWLVDSQVFCGGRVLNIVINTIYYLLQLLVCYLWANYCYLRMKIKKNKLVQWLMNLLLIFGSGMMLVNMCTGVVFSVNESNVYIRTWGLWGTMQAACCIIFILISLGCTIGKMAVGDAQLRSEGKYLLLVSLLPMVCMIVQMKIYGLNFIWSGMALALLLVLVEVEMKQYQNLKNEFADQRIQIMLSQIQPHFLYNSLSTIQSICKKEPEAAEKAIHDFAVYLRGNMDSLGSKAPIPFEKELNHVKNYLSLERLRFGDQLNVEYDIEVTDFFLPALTLQPIVENAVKYGVRMKEEGGTITIIARKDENEFIVTVIDDGPGITVKSIDDIPVKKDGRSHIGLINVRNRLERMLGGILEIDSTPGEGTSITIRIPK